MVRRRDSNPRPLDYDVLRTGSRSVSRPRRRGDVRDNSVRESNPSVACETTPNSLDCTMYSNGQSPGRRKQPVARQHFLNRFPDSHGQRSLRPSFSVSSFSPCTMRRQRLTRVSDGKPRRRLLMTSKAEFLELFFAHGCLLSRSSALRRSSRDAGPTKGAESRHYCHDRPHPRPFDRGPLTRLHHLRETPKA